MEKIKLKILGKVKKNSVSTTFYYNVDDDMILLTNWNFLNPSWESTIEISKDLVLKLAKMIENKEI